MNMKNQQALKVIKKTLFFIFSVIIICETGFFLLGLYRVSIVDSYFEGDAIILPVFCIIFPSAVLTLIFFFLYSKEIKLISRLITLFSTPVFFFITNVMANVDFGSTAIHLLLIILCTAFLIIITASQILTAVQYLSRNSIEKNK